MAINVSGLESEIKFDSNNITISLVNRIKWRLTQDDNALWASASLLFLCFLIFIAIVKSQLWKKYSAPKLLGLHDDIEELTYQYASDVNDSKKRWNFRFRRKRAKPSPSKTLNQQQTIEEYIEKMADDLTSLSVDPQFPVWLIKRFLSVKQLRDYYAKRMIEKLCPIPIATSNVPSSDVNSNAQLIRKVLDPNVVQSRQAPSKVRAFEHVCHDISTKLRLIRNRFVSDEPFMVEVEPVSTKNFGTPGTSRDAMQLYTIQKWVNNLIYKQKKLQWDQMNDSQKNEELLRICSVGRGIARLLQRLYIRLSNAQVGTLPQLADFATTISVILNQFVHHIKQLHSIFESLMEILFFQLKLYDEHVTTRLQQVAIRWKQFHQRYVTAMIKESSSEKSPSHSYPKLRYLNPDFKPKGYLLPLSLKEKRLSRRKNIGGNSESARKHIKTPVSTTNNRLNKQVFSQNGHERFRKRPCEISRTVDDMLRFLNHLESKWSPILDGSVDQIQKPKHIHSATQIGSNTISERNAQQSANRLAGKIMDSAVTKLCFDLDRACDLIVDDLCEQELQM